VAEAHGRVPGCEVVAAEPIGSPPRQVQGCEYLLERNPLSQPVRSVAAFWIVAAIMLVSIAASAAPSPLYPIYAVQFHLSTSMLTIAFAVYVIGLLASLVVAGALSDFVGRKPVLAVGVLGIVGAMVLFVFVDGFATLIIARTVQGLANGILFGASGASLLDHSLEKRPAWSGLLNGALSGLGLAAGALASGLLVQFGPAPRQTVYVLFGVLAFLGALALFVVPESVKHRPGALRSLVPHVSLTAASRPVFRTVAGGLISCWALGGLYLSLVPSVLRADFGITNHIAAGALIAIFTGVGAVTGIAVQKMSPEHELLASLIALVVGSTVTIIFVADGSFVGTVVGTVIAGAGFGASFQAALRLLLATVQTTERAALISAVYTISYLSLGIPSVIAGVLQPAIGLTSAIVGYGIFVALAAAIAFVMQLLGMRRSATTTTG
jgi:MFS family permease